MKFLDSNGLAHFWSKVKTFVSNNYLSLDGGQINGGVTIDSSDDNVLMVLDSASESEFRLYLNPHNITMTKVEENSDGNSTVVTDLEINQGKIKANMFVMNEGTSTEVLIANGSVKGIGSANGIAGLDSNGYVPLAQLGNLDTTVAEVVTAFPTTNIKKHIYLIKDTDGVTQNQYEEYLYTGDTSATYDASKWEKLGDFRPTIDLADYAKKSEAIDRLIVNTQSTGPHSKRQYISIYKAGSSSYESEVVMLEATTNMSGFMSAQDKSKLDGIELNANDYSLPLAAANTRGGIKVGYQANSGFPVKLDSEERAYVTIPIATQDKNGLFSYTDQKKLDRLDLSNLSDSAIVYMDSILKNVRIDKDTSSVSLTLVAVSDDETEVTIQAATSSLSGVMSASDKAKLDRIASGATEDSAITTAEIDALFA